MNVVYRFVWEKLNDIRCDYPLIALDKLFLASSTSNLFTKHRHFN